MENLEGGLDYLKAVVIDDKLGLAAELEQQMEHIVDTFVCEWKNTIEDPEKLKRFDAFINSDEVFVPARQIERDQAIPTREVTDGNLIAIKELV